MIYALVNLFKRSSEYKRQCVRATCFSIANKVFDIAPELLIGVAVDVVVQKQQSWLAGIGFTSIVVQLGILGGLTLLIWGSESYFQFLYSIEWRRLAQLIQHDLRVASYSHIQKLSISYFEQNQTGNLTSILNDDINQLERFLDRGANDLLQVVTSSLLIGATFFYLAPLVAVFAMLPIPIIILGAFYYKKKIEPMYGIVRGQAGRLTNHLMNNIIGMSTIKVETTEEYEIEKIRSESLRYLESNRRVIQVSSAFIPLIRLAILSGFVVTLVLGGWLTTRGSLAIGSYSVLIFLTQRLLWPFTSLAETTDLYQRAMASLRRILNLLELPIERPAKGSRHPLKVSWGELRFENVEFQYPLRPPLLKGLSLTVRSGSTTAIVGSTGSGKSTVAKLILRLYEPTRGSIFLDGIPIEEQDLGELRKSIGYVPQDPFFFDGSIRDNICYGTFSASLMEVQEATKAAEAHEFILSLPSGYDTPIGERGQRLSGGQRQRLALARAILKNPRILILDEATSAIDNETERLIQKSLEKISSGKTVIIIAHRLSTIQKADCIYLMQNGSLMETGTHEELLQKNGLYNGLWNSISGISTAE